MVVEVVEVEVAIDDSHESQQQQANQERVQQQRPALMRPRIPITYAHTELPESSIKPCTKNS